MKLAFRLVYYKKLFFLRGFVFAFVSIGMMHPKHTTDFLVGRSLFEISHLQDGWFMDILFIHILTFSKLFWKGVF